MSGFKISRDLKIVKKKRHFSLGIRLSKDDVFRILLVGGTTKSKHGLVTPEQHSGNEKDPPRPEDQEHCLLPGAHISPWCIP